MHILSTIANNFIIKWLSIRITFILILFKNILFSLSKPWHAWYIANYSSQYWHNFNSKLNYYNDLTFRNL